MKLTSWGVIEGILVDQRNQVQGYCFMGSYITSPTTLLHLDQVMLKEREVPICKNNLKEERNRLRAAYVTSLCQELTQI